jgi:hypothetical protein
MSGEEITNEKGMAMRPYLSFPSKEDAISSPPHFILDEADLKTI